MFTHILKAEYKWIVWKNICVMSIKSPLQYLSSWTISLKCDVDILSKYNIHTEITKVQSELCNPYQFSYEKRVQRTLMKRLNYTGTYFFRPKTDNTCTVKSCMNCLNYLVIHSLYHDIPWGILLVFVLRTWNPCIRKVQKPGIPIATFCIPHHICSTKYNRLSIYRKYPGWCRANAHGGLGGQKQHVTKIHEQWWQLVMWMKNWWSEIMIHDALDQTCWHCLR